MAPGEFPGLLAVEREGGDLFGMRNEAARDEPFAGFLDAENGEGIAMLSGNDGLDVGGGGLSFRSVRLLGRRIVSIR